MKTQYSKLIPKVRLTLIGKSDKIFGSGIAELLHYINKHESIRKACKEMRMSYTKAWKIIKKLEKELGCPVLESKIGGKNGGESSLTSEGKDLIKRYDAMMKDLNRYSKDIYKKYFLK